MIRSNKTRDKYLEIMQEKYHNEFDDVIEDVITESNIRDFMKTSNINKKISVPKKDKRMPKKQTAFMNRMMSGDINKSIGAPKDDLEIYNVDETQLQFLNTVWQSRISKIKQIKSSIGADWFALRFNFVERRVEHFDPYPGNTLDLNKLDEACVKQEADTVAFFNCREINDNIIHIALLISTTDRILTRITVFKKGMFGLKEIDDGVTQKNIIKVAGGNLILQKFMKYAQKNVLKV